MGLMKYYDPVTKKRVPIKAGSLVNDTGAPNEATPDSIKATKDTVDAHVVNEAIHVSEDDRAKWNKVESLQGVRIHEGLTEPIDTNFWYDINDN